ncbi:hypothetical protein [Pseudorhodoferax sp.]|uniref:hypothetical protein n=1 Tax=Pseudorhodoferax sp. TaxID=1993553 RepID=UPI0039E5C1D1
MSKKPQEMATDPMAAWRDWFVQSERQWSEGLTRLMQDEQLARRMGQEIHAGLHRQKMLQESMAGPLGMMNLPSREDVLALSERIGRLEDAVARVEASLNRTAPPATPRPARTRKAPAPVPRQAGR